ncbi:MAG: FtsX-like permease family protein [Candidatus Brocadiaceae bacterium]|nr:FtsX-like permease family protein [Candidatus Brocadiaceae bacterium]
MFIKILFRNVFRHKLRTILTMCGIAVAILSFGLLRTVIDAWYAGVDASSTTRLITRNSISLTFRLPLSYRDKIRRVEGITTVSYGNWFGGYYIDEKIFFANFAVEPQSYLELYPEYLVSDNEKDVFLKNRKGCMVGQKLADRFDWNIGDIITLKGTIFPGNWEFQLNSIYKGRDSTIDETLFFFHWDYLNETVKKTKLFPMDQVGFYIIGVKSPDLTAQAAMAIDNTFENSLAETLTETEKAFQMSFVSMSETILQTIQLVSLVVIFIILSVVVNTMSMSVRERIGEYSVLKSLGFHGWHICALIIGESLVITCSGGVFGILSTFPASKAFSAAVGTYFPVFNITLETICLDLGVSIIVGVVAGIFSSWKAVTVRISEGLRKAG